MNDKPTRWDYITAVVMAILCACWAAYEYHTDPDKIHFEPVIALVTGLFAIWGYSRWKGKKTDNAPTATQNNNEIHTNGSNNIIIQSVTDSTITLMVNGEVQELRKEFAELRELLEKQHTQTFQVGDKVYNIGSINEAKFSAILNNVKNAVVDSTIHAKGNVHIGDNKYIINGGVAIVVVALIVIAIWQKDVIKDYLGLNRFFKANDSNFKILVLPFKQICVQNDKNYDAGFIVTERLNDITNKEKLKIKTYYWADYDFKDFNDEEAKYLRQYHNADMILFGAYETDACAGGENKVCINYITDEKWNMGNVGINLYRDYESGGIKELRTGKLQEKVENLATFISLLAQVKSINHESSLAKLKGALINDDLDKSLQAAIYIEIADKLYEEGKLAELLVPYEKALKIYEVNKDKSGIALCYSRIGITHTNLGNLLQALVYFEEVNKLFKELHAVYPENVGFKNGLAVSYENLGITQNSLGNLTQAFGYFEEETKLFKELHAAYPDNVDFKNGLAVSYQWLGNTHTSLGNLTQALGYFEEETNLFKQLHAAYPDNVDFKNGLAISYSKLGDAHDNLGNWDKDLGFYENMNKLFQELCAAYPNNVRYKHGLAVSYSKLGDAHTSSGNLEKALVCFEEYHKLSKELHAAYPDNVGFKNGLAISNSRLGGTQRSLGNLDKALVYFDECHKLSKELHASYPDDVGFKKSLAVSYQWLGNTHTSLGNLDKALRFFKEYHKLSKELHAAFPDNVDFKNSLAISYLILGQVSRQKGDTAQAKTYSLQAQILWHESVR